MKRLLIVAFAACALQSTAQQTKIKNLEVQNTFKMGNSTITGVSKDSTSAYGSDDKLITERAAKSFARTNGGGGASNLESLLANSVSGGYVPITNAYWINSGSNQLVIGATGGAGGRASELEILQESVSLQSARFGGIASSIFNYADSVKFNLYQGKLNINPSFGYGLRTAASTDTTVERIMTYNTSTGQVSKFSYWPSSMVYPGTGIPISNGSGWSASIANNSTDWNTAYTDRLKWDGGSTGLNAATGRTSLGLGTFATRSLSENFDLSGTWSFRNSSGITLGPVGNSINLFAGGLTSDYSIDFQSKDGTVALLDDIPSVNTTTVNGIIKGDGSTMSAATPGTDYATPASVALKSDINSPTFTGTPSAPTPSTSDNSTKVATTAFTKAAINQTLSDSAFSVVNPVAATYPLALPISSTKLMVKGLKSGTNVTISSNADSTYTISSSGGSGISPKTERELYSYNLYNDASLVSYYRLENVNDSKGSNNLTDHNTVPFNAGKFNNSADFGTSNTNKYLSAGNLGVAGNVSMTISCWVKVRTEPSAATFVFVGHASSSGLDRQLQIKYREASGVKYVEVDAGGSGTVSYVKTLGTTNWHHLAVTRNITSSRVSLYIDGVLVQVEDIGGSGPGGFDAFGIGSSYEGTNFASAYVEDVAVFSRALTALEISQLAIPSPDIEIGTSPVNVYSPVNRNAVLGNPLNNFSTRDQTIAAATTATITGSRIAIPANGLQIGSFYTVRLSVSKTSAGTAACSYLVKLGTTGTTSDATIATLTLPVGTAVADKGTVDITVLVRGPITASCIANCHFSMVHNLQTTGLANVPGVVLNTNSSAFDATASGLILSVACTTAASTVYTFQQVYSEVKNM